MNVGIDLGTTNSALAYIDPREAEDADFPPIHILSIPQHVRAGTVEPQRTLPSFLFLGDEVYTGTYAREQGALVPTRSVHSAKSWLSNPDVDRTAKILPWDAQEAGRTLSPVEASVRYLAHLRDAWDGARGEPLSEQRVVLTVPASFDEEARELTVDAARQAGIENLTLLEEPAAAFYSWIANHLAQSQKTLFDGQMVLVCDVGVTTGGINTHSAVNKLPLSVRVAMCRAFLRTSIGRTMGGLLPTTLDESHQIRLHDGPAAMWSGIKADVLLTYGTAGPRYYAGLNAALAQALQHAQVLPIRGSGHDGLNRAPSKLVEALAEFFAAQSR